MASSGAFRANIYTKGFKKTDPLVTRLRRGANMVRAERFLLRAMKIAAEPMREEMGARAPVDTGQLSRSYRTRKLQKTPKNVIGIRVGAVSGESVVGAEDFDKITGVLFGQQYTLAGWRDHWAELGTIHHAPQPHVGPAIKNNLSKYRKELGVQLALLLKKTYI
jgi:HK97 gp10 family phage protein